MKKNLFSKFFRNREIDVEKTETLLSSLAPKVLTKPEDIEKIQPYLDKLKESINTKGISNIALTGGYGSGKSTIIGTFKELNPEYEYLNISLASFNKKEDDSEISSADKKIQKEEIERLLEVSILQQIFYHVKPQQIPESRFKRIDNISGWRIFGISIGFILWVICTTLLLKYNYLDKINPTNWNTKDKFDWWSLPIFLVSLTGLGILSKLVINLFSNSKISKVNIKGELELGDNINKSVFNEHLEEILYFFERTRYNVVLIEDLDRFDSTDIFTKLREINILLNNSLLISREINFVYAVGDDLFGDKKERVKFFEYIIPVIPFINSSNADEQLQNLISESGLDKTILTKELISDVTTFIDDIDMRLLTNIFHEFVIYRKTLKPEFIKKNDELFAIITYKNLDPKDFNSLNKKEGKLYELINNKKIYIEKFIEKIDNEIRSKDEEIKNIDNEVVYHIKELRSIYVNKLVSKIGKDSTTTIDISELLDDENFENIINNELEYEKFSYNNYYSRYDKTSNKLDFNFEDIENTVNPDFSYNKRIELIESKQADKSKLLKNEIDKLKSKKSQIENWDLKQIFNEIEVAEYLESFSNNKLLRNLILNGYINENYNDYISLFHEVSVTKEDYVFERNVKSGYATEFNYKLNKIENLIERIDLRYYSRETILNFDLVDFLSSNYSRYSKKYDAIINLLSNDKPNSIKFIDEFIDENRGSIDVFFIRLIEEWKDFWEYIYWNSGSERINKYVGLIIRYIDVSTFINNQNGNILKAHIESDSQFLNSIQIFVNNEPDEFNEFYGLVKRQMKNYIKELDIKFEIIDNYEFIDSDLYEYVYLNSHYEINETNISQILSKFGENYDENDFKKSNYSVILNSDCHPLIEYINSDINFYVENVYLKLENNKFDTEKYVTKLLNDNNLKDGFKAKIIQRVETKISELKDINDLSIKSLLLINNKVVPKWSNIIGYYLLNENKITDILIDFLNFEDVYSELSEQKITEENKEFEVSLIKCYKLLDESYNSLLNSTQRNWNNINFENLNEEKVINLLIKKLSTTKDNYDRLKEHFPNNHIKLVEKDFTKFCDNLEQFETDEADVILLLKSDEILLNNKILYISKLDEQTISDSKSISELVGNLILQHEVKVSFESTTIAFIVKSISSIENSVRLTNLYVDSLSNSELVEAVKNIGYNYKELFVKQHKPTFKKTEYNHKLLSTLKSKELINSFNVDKKDGDLYRAVANY